MNPAVRPFLPRGRVWMLVVMFAALTVHGARADDPAPTNAAPVHPLPFLAPPPLTSNQPEAPEIRPLPEETPATAPENPGAGPSTEAPLVANQPHFSTPAPPRFFNPAGQPEGLAAHLLVVYNANDPDSAWLAHYYAKRRAIPDERVLAISCSTHEEISRDEFDRTIREPILDDLFAHKWIERTAQSMQVGDLTLDLLAATRNDIWAIVLIRGVPLKIADAPSAERGMEPQAQLKTTAAAVDSELALLPVFGLPLGGFVPNPFFDLLNTGEVRAGPELATRVVLVTRLDGPTVAEVRRMIDDCLAVENTRLAGSAVIDSRGFVDPSNGYTEGDIWLRRARDRLAADGWPVLFDDQPTTLSASEPLNHVALYLGWYTPNADGPWITPPDRFVPGAIAYHLHSFSAWTVRSPTENWVGPLIAHGADATLGNVYEPYLGLTPHLDIFTHRLLDGDSFAEAAYASELGLSWMTTVVGDPLYRPFRKPLAQAIADAPPGAARDWLRLQGLERQLDARPPADAAALVAAFQLPGAGAVLNERLGDLLQKFDGPAPSAATEQAYKIALQQSTEPIDCIRIGLKLAQVEVARHEDGRARAQLSWLRQSFPADSARLGISPIVSSSRFGLSRVHARPFDSDSP